MSKRDRSHVRTVEACLERADLLNGWELQFLRGLRSASLHVNDALGLYQCFGCGAGGDVVRFVMEAERLRFMDALRWLGAADLPPVDQEAMAHARIEDAAARAEAIGEARAVWEAAQPAAATPAETYARSRGITAPLPPSIRFTRTYAWRDRATGETGPERQPAVRGKGRARLLHPVPSRPSAVLSASSCKTVHFASGWRSSSASKSAGL